MVVSGIYSGALGRMFHAHPPICITWLHVEWNRWTESLFLTCMSVDLISRLNPAVKDQKNWNSGLGRRLLNFLQWQTWLIKLSPDSSSSGCCHTNEGYRPNGTPRFECNVDEKTAPERSCPSAYSAVLSPIMFKLSRCHDAAWIWAFKFHFESAGSLCSGMALQKVYSSMLFLIKAGSYVIAFLERALIFFVISMAPYTFGCSKIWVACGLEDVNPWS